MMLARPPGGKAIAASRGATSPRPQAKTAAARGAAKPPQGRQQNRGPKVLRSSREWRRRTGRRSARRSTKADRGALLETVFSASSHPRKDGETSRTSASYLQRPCLRSGRGATFARGLRLEFRRRRRLGPAAGAGVQGNRSSTRYRGRSSSTRSTHLAQDGGRPRADVADDLLFGRRRNGVHGHPARP